MIRTAPEEEATLRAFVEETYKAHQQTQSELRELEVLVKQCAAEVEHLAQRNSYASGHIRQLLAHLDTVPREDVKEGYEALINAQQRLFTMRGQLEKLQSDRHNLQKLAELQERLLEMGSGLADLPKPGREPQDATDVIRVIQSEETARQSLVRRMHDGPASSLSNFILQAEICQRYFDTSPEQARAELNALKGAAATTFHAVKNFIFDLRPMMLDDLGAAPTLRRYAETFAEKGGVPVAMTITGVERRLESYLEVTIFRAVQELLNNAAQHGQPSQIDVLLDLGQDRILAAVEDNGRGFSPQEVFGEDGRRISGLTTLRQRLEMLGGDLTAQSAPGQGARVEFTLPVTTQGTPMVH